MGDYFTNKVGFATSATGLLLGDLPAGMSNDYGIYTPATTDTLGLWSERADGSGNVSVAIVADVNAASINAAHKVLSLGWVNNSDVYAELLSVKGNGGVYATLFTETGALALGTTTSESHGAVFRNTTAAAAGAQQISPQLYLAGQGWTTFDNTSRESVWRIYNLPAQSAVTGGPLGQLRFDHSVGGGAYGNVLSISPALAGVTNGGITVTGAATISGAISGTTITGSSTVTGTSLKATADAGGTASQTVFTNATAAKDSTAATLGNTPTGIAGAHAAWMKIYIGTTTAYVPYWTA